jgi:hypothetical protein
MKLFSRIRELRDVNAAAAEVSQQVIAQASAHGAEAEQKQGIALERLAQATAQAKRLSAADQRNHYSESLTQSFRGKPA